MLRISIYQSSSFSFISITLLIFDDSFCAQNFGRGFEKYRRWGPSWFWSLTECLLKNLGRDWFLWAMASVSRLSRCQTRESQNFSSSEVLILHYSHHQFYLLCGPAGSVEGWVRPYRESWWWSARFREAWHFFSLCRSPCSFLSTQESTRKSFCGPGLTRRGSYWTQIHLCSWS